MIDMSTFYVEIMQKYENLKTLACDASDSHVMNRGERWLGSSGGSYGWVVGDIAATELRKH